MAAGEGRLRATSPPAHGHQSHKRSMFFTRLCRLGLGSHALAAWGQSPVCSENREREGRGRQPLPPPVTTTLQLAGKQKQFLRLASLPGVQGLVGLVSAEDPGREGFHTKQK